VSITATKAVNAATSRIFAPESKVYCSAAGFSLRTRRPECAIVHGIDKENTMPLALWALTLSAFAIGTTEFVIVGLIPTIAASLRVSVPSAGLLVSLYALGVAVGAPVLTAVTGRVPRKTLLLGLMLLFTAGNLTAWMAPGYAALMAARVLTGLAHGVFFSIGSTIATSLVPKEKAASAIALMFSGLTVALVTGVPLGTFIGQRFGWHATFLAVALLGVVAFAGIALLVPRGIAGSAPAGLLTQLAVLKKPRLLLVYAMTALGYGGSFIAFTYLAPILERVAGFAPDSVGLMMLVYGVSVAFGNIWGGRLADRKGPVRALQIVFALLAAVLFVLDVTAAHKVAVLATVLAWGGGLIVAHLGLMHTPWIGGLVVVGALALTTFAGRLDRRDPAPRPDRAARPERESTVICPVRRSGGKCLPH
jgi:predicted MFS family arabinose efflux permease